MAAKTEAGTQGSTTQAGSLGLKEADPEIYALIQAEQERQICGLELIASENFTSNAVMDAVGSVLTNKYSEGLPHKRYYGGNEVIDRLEVMCQKRALAAFRCDPEQWGVNVQPYSGSVANFAAFTAMLQPGDRVMGLHLPDGGHLSHGFFAVRKSGEVNHVNISSRYFESMPYHIDPETGYLDYDDLEKMAKRFRPKLIVCGASAYPRDYDYKRFREICDACGARLMVDMAHYSGLVASQCLNDPFEFADIVTTTTHKSLRSTRAAMIFYRNEHKNVINSAVFPGTQGGPHNHAIAGIAVQLKEVATEEFTEYSKQVIKNAQVMADQLQGYGYKIVTGGTDNHLVLWDLRELPGGGKISGGKYEAICDAVHITCNKNTVHGDKSALNPGGVRLGSPALTSRGFKEKDFETVCAFLHEACELGDAMQKEMFEATGSKKVVDFKKALVDDERVAALRGRVQEFSKKFYMPGRFI